MVAKCLLVDWIELIWTNCKVRCVFALDVSLSVSYFYLVISLKIDFIAKYKVQIKTRSLKYILMVSVDNKIRLFTISNVY